MPDRLILVTATVEAATAYERQDVETGTVRVWGRRGWRVGGRRVNLVRRTTSRGGRHGSL